MKKCFQITLLGLVMLSQAVQADYRGKVEDIVKLGGGEVELLELNHGPIGWDYLIRSMQFKYKYAEPGSAIYKSKLTYKDFAQAHVVYENINYSEGDVYNFGEHTDPYPKFTLNYVHFYENYYNKEENCSVSVQPQHYNLKIIVNGTYGKNSENLFWNGELSARGYRATLNHVVKCLRLAKRELGHKELKLFVLKSKNYIQPRPEDGH